ncbi:MAG: glutamate racemase [Clostridia bacterium]|nr:glutamate racemase [Clostridia bacterium]
MDNRPIGIFDSGVGGLTVLKEYLKELPNENYIYFGDTARLPYGSKSKNTIVEFSKQITEFLISQNVKLIVIACGTASAIAYQDLVKSFDLPIIDIISPTAKAVKDSSIGVIATKATIKSQAWENEIHQYSPHTKIHSIACPLFVPIVEEGFADSEIAKLAVKEYLSAFEKSDITSLILGCTHYPILKNTIQTQLGEKIKLMNAGHYSALYAKEYLEQNNLLAENTGELSFYSSDDGNYFKEIAKNFFPVIENYNVQKCML